MWDYLKNMYERSGIDLLAKWQEVFPVLVKAIVVLLVVAFIWGIFKRVLKRVQKRAGRYDFFRHYGDIFILIKRAVGYALVFFSGIYLINLFQLPVLEKIFFAILIILLAMPVKDFALLALKYLENLLAKKTETKVDDIVFDLANKFTGVIVFAIAILLALDVLELM